MPNDELRPLTGTKTAIHFNHLFMSRIDIPHKHSSRLSKLIERKIRIVEARIIAGRDLSMVHLVTVVDGADREQLEQLLYDYAQKYRLGCVQQPV